MNLNLLVTRVPFHLKRGNCCCKECKAIIDKLNNKKGCGQIYGSYWSSVKANAKARGVDFSITEIYAWEQFEKQCGSCALSGVLLVFPNNKKEYLNGKMTASIDRIDSSKGYIPDNIQWIHKWINRMKSNRSQAEFIDLCCSIADFQRKTNGNY